MQTQAVALFLTAGLFQTLYADGWGSAMVTDKKIDFGVIATGSEAKIRVPIKNVHDFPVHISDVKTTCGCSAAATGERTIPPGGSTFVEVQMNTSKFRQRKDSNLIIQFDAPQFDEVRIPITAYIRTDVVFDPGAIRFGSIAQGAGGVAKIRIAYAGRPDWDIENIKIPNSWLKATLSPPRRESGQIHFELKMELSPSVKSGPLRDVVTLVTNDARNPFVPLMVEGNVRPDISVTPAVVDLGRVVVGDTKRARVVLKGSKPFKVTRALSRQFPDELSVELSAAAKPVQLIPIEFVAPNGEGRFTEDVVLTVEGRPEPLKVRVTGTVIKP